MRSANSVSPKHTAMVLSRYAVGMSEAVAYLTGRRTPARMLQERVVQKLFPRLKGEIIEFGAVRRRNYASFATGATGYKVSNLPGTDSDVFLDLMKIGLADDSAENFAAFSVLEHVENRERALDEIFRTLKPGGKILITIPFMYPVHAAPDDFARYTPNGLLGLFKKFNILHLECLGNYFSLLALFLQNSKTLGSWRLSGRKRIIALPMIVALRFLGTLLLLLSPFIRSSRICPVMIVVLAEKPSE